MPGDWGAVERTQQYVCAMTIWGRFHDHSAGPIPLNHDHTQELRRCARTGGRNSTPAYC